MDLATVAVGRKRVGIESVTGLEARKAGLVAAFDSAEECLERFVETAQNVLTGTEIGKATGAGSTHVFQVASLIVIVERHASELVGKAPLLKGGVIEMPGLTELIVQSLYLLAHGVEPELVGLCIYLPRVF